MTDEHYALATYLHLARASELRRRWMVRDKLLLVCARRAQALELIALAEHCRGRILAHNSGHLVGHFATIAEAASDERFILLCVQAERAYSGEKAEYMLQSLGIELGHAEATYASAEEYLGSILGHAPLLDGNAASPDDDAAAAESIKATSQESAALDLDSDWPMPATRRYTDAEIAERERREMRFLWGGIATLSICILAWSAFLLRR